MVHDGPQSLYLVCLTIPFSRSFRKTYRWKGMSCSFHDCLEILLMMQLLLQNINIVLNECKMIEVAVSLTLYVEQCITLVLYLMVLQHNVTKGIQRHQKVFFNLSLLTSQCLYKILISIVLLQKNTNRQYMYIYLLWIKILKICKHCLSGLWQLMAKMENL